MQSEVPQLKKLDKDDPEWERTRWESWWYYRFVTYADVTSQRCGFLIDGDCVQPQPSSDKIRYDCGCVEKAEQNIIWGFVLSAKREQSPPSKPLERSLPVKGTTNRRRKVVMQPQTNPPERGRSMDRSSIPPHGEGHSGPEEQNLDQKAVIIHQPPRRIDVAVTFPSIVQLLC